MRTRLLAWGVWLSAGVLSLAAAVWTNAETNTVPRAPVVPPLAGLAEPDLFFTEYAKAVRLLQNGERMKAETTMDLLSRQLSSAPWLEVAILKRGELIEQRDTRAAVDAYEMVQRRLATAPFYQGTEKRAQLFRQALQASTDNGIARLRLLRVREALGNYYGRYGQYPESLAKLSIFNYVDMQDIIDPRNQPFRYVPTGMQLRGGITYQRFDLETRPAPAFWVNSPRIESTSQLGDQPGEYVCLIRVLGHRDPVRVTRDQTLEGYYIGLIASGGAIVCQQDKLLVLPVLP